MHQFRTTEDFVYKRQSLPNMPLLIDAGGQSDEARLTRKFGIDGRRLKEMGQGVDKSPVIQFGEEDDVKSVGHSSTYRA